MYALLIIISDNLLKKIIVSTLRRNYCRGWTLSAHICKNDKTCSNGQLYSHSNLSNALNENGNLNSVLKNCKHIHIYSNDEFIIPLISLKELVSFKSRMKFITSNVGPFTNELIFIASIC